MVKRSKSKSAPVQDLHGRTSKLKYYWRRVRIYALILVPVAIGLAFAFLFKGGQDSEGDSYRVFVDQTLWRVVDMPAKHGIGVLAKRNISQGTLILRENPLFLLPRTKDGLSAQSVAAAVSKISPQKRRLFDTLSHHIDPTTTGDNRTWAKFHTNSFMAGNLAGVFPYTARMNHGCSSSKNIGYSWRGDTNEMHSYALKDITEGDELLTEYMDTTKMTRLERQQFLQNFYQFRCRCSVCSLPKEESEASDSRLSKLRELDERLGEWGNIANGSEEPEGWKNGIDGPEITKIINEIWKLTEEEGVFSGRGPLAWYAAKLAASHSDELAAREWARLRSQMAFNRTRSGP